MKQPNHTHDSWSVIFFIAATIITIAQITLLWFFDKSLPPQVPLFYSLPWGEVRLTPPIWLWLLPALSAGLVIVNLGMSRVLNKHSLMRLLAGSAFLTSLLLLITLIKIILLGLPWAYF